MRTAPHAPLRHPGAPRATEGGTHTQMVKSSTRAGPRAWGGSTRAGPRAWGGGGGSWLKKRLFLTKQIARFCVFYFIAPLGSSRGNSVFKPEKLAFSFRLFAQKQVGNVHFFAERASINATFAPQRTMEAVGVRCSQSPQAPTCGVGGGGSERNPRPGTRTSPSTPRRYELLGHTL
jgi:hypothetical protein